MTLILAAETQTNRYMIALSFPPYRPSILAWVILALVLATLGLAVDVILFPAAVGTVALWAAALAAGVVWGLAALEVMRR
jgi:hypothetical protein